MLLTSWINARGRTSVEDINSTFHTTESITAVYPKCMTLTYLKMQNCIRCDN